MMVYIDEGDLKMSFIDDYEELIEKELDRIDNLYELGHTDTDGDINVLLELPEDHDWLMTWYDDYTQNGVK